MERIAKNKLVKVIDPGYQYSSYDEWININANKYYAKWKDGTEALKRNTLAYVVTAALHEDGNTLLYLIRTKELKNYFIIGAEGIEEVTK